MATTSYLKDIDTRPIDIKPTRLPYEAFMQEYQAKSQYFGESAAMIQQAHKNVLDIDPMFKQNKEYLKGFLAKAQDNLAKVLKSDMTVTDNAANGQKVYSQIFDTSNDSNRLLLTDSQLNKHYQNEIKKSDSARTANGGKNWNAANEFYFKSQYQQYVNDANQGKDPNLVNQHYENRKSFIPYHDILPDLKAAKDLCEESSHSTTKVNAENYLLFDNNSVSGVSQNSMQNCLGFLPDAAKQQIGINAYAQYYNNREGLKQDYKAYFVDKRKQEADMASLKYAALAGMKDVDKNLLAEFKMQHDEKKALYEQGLSEWNNIIGKGTESDFINKNFENISSVVGNLKLVERASVAMSWQKIEDELSVNAAGIAKFNAEKAIYLSDRQFNQDLQMTDLKQMHEQANITLKGNIDLAKEGMKLDKDGKIVSSAQGYTDAGISADAEISSKLAFDQELDNSMNAMTGSLNGLNNAVMSYIDNSGLDDKTKQNIKSILNNPKYANYGAISNFIDVFEKSGIKDPMIIESIKAFRNDYQKFKNISYEKKTIEKGIKNSLNEVYTDLSTSSGQKPNLTGEEIATIFQGGTVKGLTSNDFNYLTLEYFNRRVQQNKSIENDKREEAYRTRFRNGNKYFNQNTTEKQTKEEEFQIKSLVNIPDEYMITKPSQDKDGNVIFQVKRKEKNEDGVEIIKTLNDKEIENIVARGGNMEVISFPGRSKNSKDFYIKLPRFKEPLPGYINTELARNLTVYTEAEMPSQSGTWAKDKTGQRDETLSVTSSTGKEYKVQIGNINGNPIFKLSTMIKGKWQTFETTYNSIEAVSAVIENNKGW